MPSEVTAGYGEKLPPPEKAPEVGDYRLTRETATYAPEGVTIYNVLAPDGIIIGVIRCRSKEESRAISDTFSSAKT